MTTSPGGHVRPRNLAFASALLAPFLTASLAAGPAAAQTSAAIGIRAGTAGLGVDLVTRASDRAHIRLAAGTVGFSDTISTPDIDYDADVEITTALLLLDWFPAAGAFRLSAGAGWNGSEVHVTAPLDPLAPRDPDLLALFPSIGSAVGTAQGNELVPVVLLGWGNPFRGSRWSLSFEIGAFYHGEPEVELDVQTEVPVDQIPGGLEALGILVEQQERELARELDDYTVVPIVSFSLTYRF